MRGIGHALAFAIKGYAIQARAAMTNPAAAKPPPKDLSSAQRRSLCALAHHLEPTVLVGHHGVTEGVLRAVAAALATHELIKVRLHEPEDKKAMARALAVGTRATLCGLVGHTAILYRRHPKQPRVVF